MGKGLLQKSCAVECFHAESHRQFSLFPAIGYSVFIWPISGSMALRRQIGDELWCQATPRAADQDAGFGLVVTTPTAIGHREAGAPIGEDFDLFKGLAKHVAVTGLPAKLRMPGTKASSRLVALLTLPPNS